MVNFNTGPSTSWHEIDDGFEGSLSPINAYMGERIMVNPMDQAPVDMKLTMDLDRLIN
jgi:hypothetical protein